jgi:DNA repair protein RecO (recombination protein O)
VSGGRDNLVPAFLLHSRAFRDTSLIIDLLTPQYGRMSVIAKGVRGGKRSRALLLQPFKALHVGWVGRGELPLLTTVEEARNDFQSTQLQGQALACGYYLNELAWRLLPVNEPAPELFARYLPSLLALNSDTRDIALREYEITLLRQIGYAPELQHDIDTGAAIVAGQRYHYRIPDGPVATDDTLVPTLSGAALQAMVDLDFSDDNCLREVRDLMRRLIHYHLEGRELESRKMFRMFGELGQAGNG